MYISTIINEENNKLVLKNVCHFQSLRISLNSLIAASMSIWMSLSMCIVVDLNQLVEATAAEMNGHHCPLGIGSRLQDSTGSSKSNICQKYLALCSLSAMSSVCVVGLFGGGG